MEYLDNVSAFYVGGTPVRVTCLNRNVVPFEGDTFWVGPMNMPVGTGGILAFDAARSLAGLYTCGVILNNRSIRINVPTRSFTLVVNSK